MTLHPPRFRRVLFPLLVALAASCGKERAPAGEGSALSAEAKPSAPPSAAPAPVSPEMPLGERGQIAGQISFISERDGNREVYLIRPDGTGERRLTSTPAADYNGPASPDGAALLSIRVASEDGPQQLFLLPTNGSAARPLGPMSGRVRYPSFSHDGRWVVFESDGSKKQGSYSDIHRVNIDGSDPKRLTNNEEGNFEPAISPRGDAIVLVSSRDRVAELYRIRPDGSEPVRLTNTPRDEWGARFSPDGELLAFVSDREGADRIYLMPAGGGPARRMTSRDLATRVVEDRPTWAPVGKKLAYVLRMPAIPSRVVIMDIESGREVLVEAPGAEVMEPAWSHDGRYLAVSIARGQDTQIHLARADGSGLTRVTSPPGGNWNPQWVPPERIVVPR